MSLSEKDREEISDRVHYCFKCDKHHILFITACDCIKPTIKNIDDALEKIAERFPPPKPSKLKSNKKKK